MMAGLALPEFMSAPAALNGNIHTHKQTQLMKLNPYG